MQRFSKNDKAAYVFASLPIVRTVYGQPTDDPHRAIPLLTSKPELKRAPPKMPECADIRATLRAKRAANARKYAPKSGDALASFMGPSSSIYGRSAKGLDLKVNLEEISDPVQHDDFWSQTDEFKARPPTPPFVPAKTGADVATQIEPWELFDFNLEVKPVLEVLVGKTVEQSLLEVAEEEELQELRKQQHIQMEILNADLAEVERLEERNRRYREEQTRRKAQASLAAIMRKKTAEKIAARSFARAYLQPLLPNVYEELTQRGYFYDDVEYELNLEFLEPLTERVLNIHHLERQARILVDGIIREAVCQRHKDYRELGREMMTAALTDLCYPGIERHVSEWLVEEMVDLFAQLMRTMNSAHSKIVSRIVRELLEDVIEEMAEEVNEAQASALESS